MSTIGPYEFTDQDARRTLAAIPALFDLLVEGLGSDAAAAAAPHRRRAEAVVSRTDASTWTADDLAEAWTAWRAGMDAVRSVGAFGPEQVGSVAGLFTSDGGVPKAGRHQVQVGFGGVVGDRQDDRANHGRPWQALCLWSTEVIDGFRAAGHPLAPGLAGENVTITGLAWDRVRPGVRLRVGSVLAEISAYSVPCRKNAAWFLDGRFDLMHHRHGPVSRVYATVLDPGAIAVGDAAVLEPAAG